jgi:Orn/Lys/Arg decarboxylase-like protein
MAAEFGAPDADQERPRRRMRTTHTRSASDASPALRTSQHEVPFLAALTRARSGVSRRAGGPGHAGGDGAAIDVRHALGRDAFACDVPMDDGAFQRAQEQAEHLAAEAWGATRAFVVHSGVGFLGWCLANLDETDHVIIARDAHAEIRSGIALCGARAQWIRPRQHPALGLPLGVDMATLDEALFEHPQTRWVVMSSPGYSGTCTDVEQAVHVAHRDGAQILVHQAWGAHLAFHPDLPVDAMAAGADAAVVNLDHNGSALSGGALLLVNHEADIPRLESVLHSLQTGSPPMAVLASIDAARRDLACASREQLDGLLTVSRWVTEHIRRIPGFHVPTSEEIGLPAGLIDPTKLVVDVSRMQTTGWEVAALLRERGTVPDGADVRYVYLVLGASESSALATGGAVLANLLDISWLLGTARRCVSASLTRQCASSLRRHASHATSSLAGVAPTGQVQRSSRAHLCRDHHRAATGHSHPDARRGHLCRGTTRTRLHAPGRRPATPLQRSDRSDFAGDRLVNPSPTCSPAACTRHPRAQSDSHESTYANRSHAPTQGCSRAGPHPADRTARPLRRPPVRDRSGTPRPQSP